MIQPKFDPANIVFSFAAVSDWHIKDEMGQYNQQKLTSALIQLRRLAAAEDANGLAAIVAAGDLTHDGKENEIIAMRRVLNSVIDTTKTAFVYVAGNHDKHDPDVNLTYDRLFTEACAKAYDTCTLSPDGVWSGARHISVRGVHFITLGPDKFYKKEPNTFPALTKQWLDETLAQITAENPNAYVFVITHQLMWDTCYGSVRGYFYASDDLTPILSKYPQVVTFGGHLHYPLNDDRAIMQTAYTAMETATMSDMLIDGHGLANVIKNTKTEGNTDFSQGLLVQMDACGNLRVTRMDFFRETTVGEPWYLDAPTADGAHLTRYTAARRESAAQEFAKTVMGKHFSIAPTTDSEDSPALALCFETARAPHPVRTYHVRVTDESDACIYEGTYLTDFYRHPDHRTMSEEMTVILPALPAGTHHISITARDCWDNESAPLVGTIEIG